jgi:hypothetical protein
MNTPKLNLPIVAPAIRDGEAVVEIRHDGALIGEINFSKVFRRWFEQLGWLKRPAPDLRSVP